MATRKTIYTGWGVEYMAEVADLPSGFSLPGLKNDQPIYLLQAKPSRPGFSPNKVAYTANVGVVALWREIGELPEDASLYVLACPAQHLFSEEEPAQTLVTIFAEKNGCEIVPLTGPCKIFPEALEVFVLTGGKVSGNGSKGLPLAITSDRDLALEFARTKTLPVRSTGTCVLLQSRKVLFGEERIATIS